MNRPILGITMGDPAGCGPEITVRALSDATVYQRCRPLVIGDIKCIRDALRVTNLSELKLHQVDRPSQGLYEFGTMKTERQSRKASWQKQKRNAWKN